MSGRKKVVRKNKSHPEGIIVAIVGAGDTVTHEFGWHSPLGIVEMVNGAVREGGGDMESILDEEISDKMFKG